MRLAIGCPCVFANEVFYQKEIIPDSLGVKALAEQAKILECSLRNQTLNRLCCENK